MICVRLLCLTLALVVLFEASSRLTEAFKFRPPKVKTTTTMAPEEAEESETIDDEDEGHNDNTLSVGLEQINRLCSLHPRDKHCIRFKKHPDPIEPRLVWEEIGHLCNRYQQNSFCKEYNGEEGHRH